MLELKPVLWFAAFDYVRLTRRVQQDDEAAKALYGKAAYGSVASGDGEVPTFKPWAWQGYYGESCGNAAYGAGNQGTLLQASGWAADNLQGMGLPFDNAPRVDMQVTVWFDKDIPYIAKWGAELSNNARQNVHGGKWAIKVIDGYGSGDTLYLGSRTSENYIRVYDKWRESGKDEAYKYAWRFEVELKNTRAVEAWSGACSLRQSPETIAGTVRWYLASRGVYLPRTVSSVLAARPEKPNRDTDNERRLAWLYNQVRPSIDKMLATGVPLDRVLSALGLDGTDTGVLG